MGDLDNNLFNEATEQYIESTHKFTEPIRYFKSNDPYYWEVDNIPLKQLEENILFLRDQVANNLSVSGIGRDDLRELRPFVNGTDRIIYVNPGRYSARINDAYKKGISNFTELIARDVKNEGGEQFGVQETNYKSQAVRQKREFTIGVDVFKKLSGEIVGEPLLDNGLYSFLQHHVVSYDGANFEWGSFNTTGLEEQGFGMSSLPNTKAAYWRATGTNISTIFSTGLQQEAVEFTRYWGGSSRTAIVDVRDVLSIEVPPFEEEEWVNNTEFAPAARIDLIFVYSHPIDVSSTTIQTNSGAVPQTITSPQLGILRGAGVIALNEGQGTYNSQYDGGVGHFDDPDYATASSLPSNYFRSENTLDLSGYKIISTMSDQLQTLVGVNGNYSNVPSPDDLLNLTPLFEEALESDSIALVGQSILPIAYVVSKRGKAVVEREDVMDIRPFLRTTELSYNERAGISAANPPLSFANPAIGKRELHTAVLETRDFIQTQLNDPVFISKPVAAGTVYGGIKHGVEGPLLSMYARRNQIALDSDEAIKNALINFKLRGITEESPLPNLPGWDLGKYGYGSGPNQWLYSTGKSGSRPYNDYASLSFGEYNPLTEFLGTQTYTGQAATVHSCLFVKKDITWADLGITMEETAEYDVQVSLANCVLQTAMAYAKEGTRKTAVPSIWNGISVEKRSDGFTIFVGLGPAQPAHNSPIFGAANNTTERLDNSGMGTVYNWMKDKEHNQRVIVTSNDFFENVQNISNFAGGPSNSGAGSNAYYDVGFGGATLKYGNAQKTRYYGLVSCTYPTVNFTVVKYQADTTNQIRGFYGG